MYAETQRDDYKGITDPFGDPANYEFADDERDDKEFFHLGRFLMVGVDLGVGLYTGGLGRSNEPGFYVGGRLVYFFDRQLALEIGIHYSNHLDSVRPDSSRFVDIDSTLIPINVGMRYYFDTRDAPKAIALANPYLGFGAGVYMRNQSVIGIQGLNLESPPDSSTSSFGGYAAAGAEFLIYRKKVYLGADLRYHMIFFPDEGDTFGGALRPGDRGGDFFGATLTLTYSF